MNIIDTSPGFCSLYDNGRFDLDRWKIYMEKYIPGAAELCLSDMEECLGAGYSWEESSLPVLESVMTEPFKREMAVRSFRVVTGRLERGSLRFSGGLSTRMWFFMSGSAAARAGSLGSAAERLCFSGSRR